MTEQPTTPEPVHPMPRLGRGVRWGAHLDKPLPPTEPYEPRARTRPAGWPKTGDIGATAQLQADEEPVTVPARPYGDDEFARLREATLDTVAEAFDLPRDLVAEMPNPRPAPPPAVDVTKPGFGIVSMAEARSWGIEPPPAVELRAMADDLNAHGGLDETFVAGLLRQVIDDDAPAMVNTQSVLKIRGELTEEEFERLRTAAIEAMADVETVPPYSWAPSAERWHQHIWTTTSPVRCVECRRYLRPWWRRTLDRVRRWRR